MQGAGELSGMHMIAEKPTAPHKDNTATGRPGRNLSDLESRVWTLLERREVAFSAAYLLFRQRHELERQKVHVHTWTESDCTVDDEAQISHGCRKMFQTSTEENKSCGTGFEPEGSDDYIVFNTSMCVCHTCTHVCR